MDESMNAPSRSTVWIRLQHELQQAFPDFLKPRRWFGSKTRTIRAVEIADVIPIPVASVAAAILVVRVNYAEGPSERYTVPLLEEADVHGDRPAPAGDNTRIVARGADGGQHVFSDALADTTVLDALFDAVRNARALRGHAGEVVGAPTRLLEPMRIAAEGKLPPSLMKAEQSNSSILYGRTFVMKLFRRLEMGINPDFEVGRFLSEKAGFRNVAPVAGSLEYKSGSGEAATMAILQGFVTNQGDAWEHTLKALADYYDRAAKVQIPGHAASTEFESVSAQLLGGYREEAALLGRRTAELHIALASDHNDLSFAPEAFSSVHQREFSESAVRLTEETFGLLRMRADNFRGGFREQVDSTLALEGELIRRFRSVAERKLTGMVTRVHGDLHLGQVLFTGSDFIFIDFEGEPARSLGERRQKDSPLRDVAGMVRSFHYAAYGALFRRFGDATARPAGWQSLASFANAWYRAISAEYLRAYFAEASGADFLPTNRDEREFRLNIWILAKAVYELKYELNHRLDWVAIPIEGIEMLVREPAAS